MKVYTFALRRYKPIPIVLFFLFLKMGWFRFFRCLSYLDIDGILRALYGNSDILISDGVLIFVIAVHTLTLIPLVDLYILPELMDGIGGIGIIEDDLDPEDSGYDSSGYESGISME